MSEKEEITFMQTRLIRLASEEWHLPLEKVIEIFGRADILKKDMEFFIVRGMKLCLRISQSFLRKRG